MQSSPPSLPWLSVGEPFPELSGAWGPGDPAPGLLAAGGALDVPTLRRAYSQGIFPWFSEGQPNLWWSPDPRMVLHIGEFKLHRSLRKVLERFRADPRCEIRIDTAFDRVIQACSAAPREGQSGTWIVPAMVQAYGALHRAGTAHSVETWIDGRLVAGLYCVGLGRAVFGESMFTEVTDGSKIALAALVALCRRSGVEWVDCQQNTRHLASLGAREIPRTAFVERIAHSQSQASPVWRFEPVYWDALLNPKPLPA